MNASFTRYKCLVALCFVMLSLSSAGQWVENIGESSGYVSGNKLVADELGNVYVTGVNFVQEDEFQGTDPDESDTVTTFQQRRIFVSKYDAIGNLIWENSIGTDSVRAGSTGIGIDATGNVYITGFYQDSLLYGNDQFVVNTNEPSLFLAKFAADGTFNWLKAIAGSPGNSITPFSLEVDPVGNCFVGGGYNGNVIIDAQSLSASTDQFFMAKFNTNGNLLWLEDGVSTGGSSYLADIAIAGNDIYVVGNYDGNLEIDGNNLVASGGKSNFFVAHYSDGGNPIVQNTFTDAADTINAVAVDSNGDLVMTGFYYNSASFDNGGMPIVLNQGGGNAAIFVVKYATDGSLLWVKDGSSSAGDAKGNGIDVDSQNNIFLTGWFGANNFPDLSIDASSKSGFHQLDLFYAMMDADGNITQLEVVADSLNDRSLDLAVGNDNQIYITGNYQDSVKVGNDVAGREFSGIKGFVAQIDLCPEITAQIAALEEEFCIGESTTLQTPLIPGHQYQWLKDKTIIDGANDNFILVSDSGEYALQIVDASLGCSKISNRIVIAPFPVEAPTITLNGDPLACIGDTLLVSVNASAQSKYQWLKDGLPTNIADTLSSLKVFETGTYQVEETNSFGCMSISATIDIEFLAFPDESLTIQGDSVFCEGENTTLLAEESDQFTYKWFKDNIHLPNDSLYFLEIDSTGSYHVEITNRNLCTSTTTPKAISIISQPEAAITFGGDSTFCEGKSVQLFANQGVNLSFSWFKDNELLPSDTLDRLTVVNSGNFQVRVENSTGCSQLSEPAEVEVYANPDVSISINGDSTFCVGESVDIVANGDPSLTYQWKRFGDDIADATGLSLTVSNSGAYAVVVTNNNECSATSNTSVVEVFPGPDAFIVPEGPTTFCEGSSVNLAANAGNNFEYHWLLNDNELENANQSILEATSTGSYQVKITNVNGCEKTSEPISVEVNIAPDNTVIFEPDLTICETDTILFSGVFAENVGYQWVKDGFEIDDANESNLWVNEPGTYSLNLISDQFCKSSSEGFEVEILANDKPVMTVTENNVSTSLFASYQWLESKKPIPGATNQIFEIVSNGVYSIEVINDNGCVNTSDEIKLCFPVATISSNNDVLTANQGNNYQWYKNNEIIEGANQQKYAVLEAGEYKVEVTNPDGCSSFSQPINRCFPNPTISVSPDFELVASVGLTYQWYKDNELLPGENGQILQVIENGDYSVKVLNFEECESRSDNYQVLVTSLKDKQIEDIEIYPNPVKNKINLRFVSNDKVELKLYDMLGKLIVEKVYTAGKVEDLINLNAIQNGVYHLWLVHGNFKKHKKIVVQQ